MKFAKSRASNLASVPLRNLLVAAVALATTTPALAQSERGVLEEVIVTAQKREESLQDVPISISTMSASTVDAFSIDSFNEFQFPGVITTEGGRTNRNVMRGISSGENSGFEQSVPIFIDGMYLGRARAQRVGFLDLSRIELLKGPQPTYLGKNAIGGAISLVTKRPTEEFEAEIDAAYEFEAQEAVATAVLSGPLTTNLQARVAVKGRQMEGWMKNTAVNEDWPQEENFSSRASFTWQPSERMSAYGKVEYYEHDYIGQARELYNCNPGYESSVGPDEDCRLNGTTQKFFVPEVNAPASNLFNADEPGDSHLDQVEYYSSMLEINYDFDSFLFTSVSAYYDLDNVLETEAGDSIIPLAFVDISETAEQFSQEFRFQTANESGLNWMLGAYYDREKISTDNLVTAPVFGVALQQHMKEQDTESWALFGEVTFDLTETLSATIGGRYAEIDKEADYERNLWALPAGSPTLGPRLVNFPLVDSQSFDDFTPSVVLEWRPTDNYMLYASYKEGFKAGGFDHSIQQPDPVAFVYDPETVVAYELGAKTVLLDGALTANLALFRSEFEDLQVTQLNIGATGFNTSNAAEARSQGLEVEVALQASEFLTLRANLNWLDAEFLDYDGAQCRGNPAQTEAEGCITDPVTGVRSQDISGQSLSYAPDFSGQFSADFRYPLRGDIFGTPIELVSNVTIFSTSAYHMQVTPDRDQEQEAFTKIDALLGIASVDGRWMVELFGRNLTDELTISNANNTPIRTTTNNAVISRTRQVGLHVKYRF